MQVEHLIVDSSAFIHNGPIRETGKNIYSCQAVIDEIKDQATLDRLNFLPYELKIFQNDQDDFNQCVEFSKKTGDYRQLSVVDLNLIAATYTLEKRFNGLKYINQEPKQVSVAPLAVPSGPKSQFDSVVQKLNSKLVSTSIEDPTKTMTDDDLNRILDDEAAVDEESSDDEGWITPQNIHKFYKKPSQVMTQPIATDRVTVACMTSDFSIQNCLLQMGLFVVSPVDGMMIKEAKQIALRCHACFKVFHDLTKLKGKFCPHCGNSDTLKRVQYFVNKEGAKRVLINFKRPIKVKGNNQQLPRPRGGKKSNNPVLTADQKIWRNRKNKFIEDEKKLITAEHILNDPAYLVRNNPFAYRDEGMRRKRRIN